MIAGGRSRSLNCRGRVLDLGHTRVMAVLNLTPDSFSDGGRLMKAGRVDLGAVRARAEYLLESGADILDLGGESTRPGAQPVSEADELARVMPVVEKLTDLDTILSVDTRKAGIARVALAGGCHMVNDVTALADPAMIELVAETGAAVCLMHMRGEPRTMQEDPVYEDVVAEVRSVLAERVQRARREGISDDRIVLDPGFGFGKTLTHNLALLSRLESLRIDGLPLLAGLSRKRMIGELTGEPVDRRVAGSVAAAVLAAERGADIVRVHDVTETVAALKVLEAVRT